MEELPIEFVHELLPEFSRLPARAIACTIVEVKSRESFFEFILLNIRFYHRLDKKVGLNEQHLPLLHVVVMNVFKLQLWIQQISNGQCILSNFGYQKLKR
jgi:hypothetical protein